MSVGSGLLSPAHANDDTFGSSRPSSGSRQEPANDGPKRDGVQQSSSDRGQGGGIAEVFKKAGLTSEQVGAIKKAFAANARKVEKGLKAEFFAQMVKKGYLTQDQADAVLADRDAMKDMVKSGEISQDNAKAIWAAMRSAPKPSAVAMEMALGSLVDAGTISQEQADVVLAAFVKMINSGSQGSGSQKPSGDKPSGDKPSSDGKNPFASTGLTQTQLETIKKTFAANMQAAGDSKNAQAAMTAALKSLVEDGTITRAQAYAVMEYFSQVAGR